MRRVLTAATMVVLFLCACGGDDDSGSSASTTLPGTTTEAAREPSERVTRFCAAAEDLFPEVASLPVDDLDSLRVGAAEAVRLLEEMEENATERMADPVLVLKAAGTRMKDTVDSAEDLEEAVAAVDALFTPAVIEATESVMRFTENLCED